uniref:Thioredoxin domain-containing protein n=1 Tax=Globodera rostochiensis TaxID=31243 RepID=A0A914H9Y4_GLORO
MSQLFENIGVRRKADNQLVNGREALQGCKVVALYFSAHWCPPCRNFTPLLKQFYEQVKKMPDASFEIVFVSFDRSEDVMHKYLAESHGNWLYIPYGSEHIQ